MSKARRGIVGIGIAVAMLLAWAHWRTGQPAGSMLSGTFAALLDGELWQSLALSLRRCALGGSIGVLLGLFFGFAIGTSRLVSTMLLPTFNLVKLVSSFAWIPLVLTWFGLGEGSKIVFIALVAYLPVLFNTLDGAMAVPATLEEVAGVYRFSRWQSFVYITAPAALPSVFTGLQLALVSSWVGTIGAEYMLTSGGGIGAYLIAARDTLDMTRLVAGVVVTGGMGFLLQAACQFAQSRVLHWRHEGQGK